MVGGAGGAPSLGQLAPLLAAAAAQRQVPGGPQLPQVDKAQSSASPGYFPPNYSTPPQGNILQMLLSNPQLLQRLLGGSVPGAPSPVTSNGGFATSSYGGAGI